MDSYDLFGEDVSGSMLDALPDLGGNDHFDPAAASNSVVVSRDGPNPGPNGGGSYVNQSYGINQESPLQKLTSFGGSEFGGANPLQSPAAAAAAAQQRGMFNQNLGTFEPGPGAGGGGVPQRGMVPGPGPGPAAFQTQGRSIGPPGPGPQQRGPPQGTHPSQASQYPGYSDSMYSMEQQHPMARANMGIDPSLQGWPGQSNAYPQMQRHYNHAMVQPSGYRQHMPQYGHQQEQPSINQKMQQQQQQQQQHFSAQQGMMSGMGVPHQPMQTSSTGSAYQHMVGQQQHYQQSSAASMYGGSSSYLGFGPSMHQQSQPPQQQPQRLPHHHPSHSTHQTHPSHQQYPPMGQHTQQHTQHSVPQQAQQQPMDPQYPHHSSQMFNQPQHPGPTAQYGPAKHATSPQYRASFPQLSPQMSPRPQISPRPPAVQQQMSPRPIMSPAKPTTLSPHPHVQLPHQQQQQQPQPVSVSPCPPSSMPMSSAASTQQTTLQALEQMVIPGVSVSNPNVPSQDYGPYQSRPPMSHTSNTIPQPTAQNPMGVTGPRMPMPSQWPPAQHQPQPQPQPQPQQPQPQPPQIRPTMNLNDGRSLMEPHQQQQQPPQQPPPPVVSEQSAPLYPMNGSENLHNVVGTTSRESTDMVQSSVHSLTHPSAVPETEIPDQSMTHQQHQLQQHHQQQQQQQQQMHQPHQQQPSQQNQIMSNQDLMSQQQRESPIHSSPQINTSIEPAPVNPAHIESVQSLPATSTSNNVECSSASPLLPQHSVASSIPVESSIVENKMLDTQMNDQTPEISSAQQQLSICPTSPLTQQPLVSQSQSLACSQSPVPQMSMGQSQMLSPSQTNQNQINQAASVTPQIPQSAQQQAIPSTPVAMGQSQQMQMVSPQQSQPASQSQVTQPQTPVLGLSPQPALQSQAQSQPQSHTSQTPQVNVLSQSNTAVTPPLQHQSASQPAIPDQSTQIQPPSQILSQTPQSQSQVPNQLTQMQSQVPNQSPQVQSSNEIPNQSTQIQPNQVPNQSTQIQSQIPDQSTQVQNQIPNQSSQLQSQVPNQLQNQAPQAQTPISTPAPAMVSATAQQSPQQVPAVGQTPAIPVQTPTVPTASPNSQNNITPGQAPFGEYTNISKTNTLYPNDMVVGSQQQTPQIYPPSDTNAVVNSTGITNINYMSPTSTPTSITPGFTNPLAPVTHHQERAALQQQLQELYCMPPAPEIQEKIVSLQEKLQALQQHENTEQCNGGPQCILQTPMFSAPAVVDSPQVSSTTGRGRSKGTSRAKKSRKKTDKEAAAPIIAQPTQPEQPVSDNLVTPGDSSNIVDSAADSVEDMKPTSGGDGEEEWPTKSKKARPPRKPRKPKEPKEPKEPKPKKEKEPKPPKEPKAPKEPKPKKKKEGKETTPKRSKKKGKSESGDEESKCDNEEVADSTAVKDSEAKPSNVSTEDDNEQVDSSTTEPIVSESKQGSDEKSESEKATGDDEKKDGQNGQADTPTPAKKKAPSRKRPSKSCSSKSPRSSKKRKSRIAPDSDGEELAATPPPSPEADDNKRRSARNTHRKKYVDDVMLRFSDDELPNQDSQGKKTDGTGATKPASDKKPNEGGDVGPNKPNFVYINTTDEDSMVVQHILCSRMGKREVKPEPPPEIKAESVDAEKADGTKSEGEKDTEEKNEENDAEKEKSKDSTSDTEKETIKEETDESDMIKEEVKDQMKKESEKTEEDEETIEKVQDEEHSKESEQASETDDEKKKEIIKSGENDNSEIQKVESTVASDTKPQMIEVEEYFVKYRNFSYLHCEWRTEEELYKGDKRIQAKLKRFKQKMQQNTNIFENTEDDPFNPDFVEVDRVLDEATHTDPTTGETVRHFLVKWRSLQYEDSTWELEEDVDPEKIAQFHKFNKLPPKDQWKPKKKPAASQWVKLDESPVYKSSNSLRPYQLEGLNWLLFSWYNGHNCILADEMGLGKTIQSLTFVNEVYKYGIRGPFLIIAPLSTIPNWQREFEGWTDMNVIVYHGSAASRTMLSEYEVYYKNDKGQQIKDLIKFNVLITTFEIIITDFNELKGYNWRLCVIDEAHRLKNRNCKLLEGLRQLNLEHRVLLSGTPLQNNVNELFSLLNFLEPTQFTSNEAFLKEFGNLSCEDEVHKLQVLLKPMMLRRLKEDVEKSLAPKEETVVEVELTNIQKKYYRGILERNFSFLAKGTTSANIPNLMNTMMELRKCCIHPFLLNGAEDQIQLDYKHEKEDSDAYYHALVNSSGKMVLIDKLLPKLKASGHRVLIFSQMVRCLDILEDYLVYKKYPYERIDGRIRGNLRQAAIDRYSKPDSDRFVFLLCTKAGGLGINLTAADTVIIYDSDWNPQNDLQAQARCHRIGQQKMVKVYRLLCRNTYEREMFDKASLKLGLDKAILQSMNTSQGGKDPGNKQLTKKEIEDLLKKGAYGAIMDDDNAGDKFCEEDIDVILSRRTQIITIEAEKGSTFSKASFACSSNRSDINIDDPDFWKKWAKKAEIDTTEKKEEEDLVISEPRRRTQIKRYGHDESVVDMSELDSSDDSDDETGGSLTGRGKKRTRDKFNKKSRKFYDEYVPREGEVVYGNWARSECFKVERGLLTFGWGRWEEILNHSQLRKGWREVDIEDCARVILLYCLRYYRGDEKIRNFIWELITPLENGEKVKTIPVNQTSSSNRNSRQKKKSRIRETRGSTTVNNNGPSDPNHWSHAEKYDGDIFLESNYRKHLSRHANKVLLRVRMLYYIKHEIIGDLVQHINDGVHVSALRLNLPQLPEKPVKWWDSTADKSLIVGCYKHGYESFDQMRSDPTLSFITSCPLPSPTDKQMDDTGMEISEIEEGESSGMGKDNMAGSPSMSSKADASSAEPGTSVSHDGLEIIAEDEKTWPSVVDLNTRLRRVITSYQRNINKKDDLKTPTLPNNGKLGQELKVGNHQGTTTMEPSLNMQSWDLQKLAMYLLKMDRKEKIEQLVKERERTRLEEHKAKWTKREESEFLRVVSTYGVNYDRKKAQYDWTKFKNLARFDKKNDSDLTEYYMSFRAMCKKACSAKINEEEGSADIPIELLSPNKARQILDRVDLLSKIREEILSHPHLEERLGLCQPSGDTPDWWQPGRHDKELLLGAAKHGLGRTDITILNDTDFSFHKMLGRSIGREHQTNKNLDKSEKAIKLENREDILKFDKDEILVKLEKGEGTLKIEKVGIKKDIAQTADKKSDAGKSQVELTIVKSENKIEETQITAGGLTITTITKTPEKEVESAKMEIEEEVKPVEVKKEQSTKEKHEEKSTEKDEADIVDENKTLKTEQEPEKVEKGDSEKKENEQKEESEKSDSKTDESKKIEETEEKNELEKDKEISEITEKNKDDVSIETEKKNNKLENLESTVDETNTDNNESDSKDETKVEISKADEKTDESGIDAKTTEVSKMDICKQEESEEETEKESEKEIEKAKETELKKEKENDKEKEKENEHEKEREREQKEKENEHEKEIEQEKEKENEHEREREREHEKEKEKEKDKEKVEPNKDKLSITKIEDKCSMQAAELKAMFPDLEVIQPLSRLTQIDTFVLRDKGVDYNEPTVAQLLSHNYQSSIKWPKEHAIEARLMHIVHAIEHKEWPVSVNFTAGDEIETIIDKDQSEIITITTDHGIPRSIPASLSNTGNSNINININSGGNNSTAIGNNITISNINSNNSSLKKRKRHIAIDVETERAKLHALLNSSHMASQPPPQLSKPVLSSNNNWDMNDESQSEDSRRSGSTQPPPAHQQTRTPAIFDLKYTVPGKPTIIPGTSSTLTPIDLSSSYSSKSSTDTSNKDMMNEVQDFSMPNKLKQMNSNKGKLDSMLDKGKVKRKSIAVEEPVMGKEKKRRKLDEIVQGLQREKEQQSTHYPEHSKKSTITPNVTVTPTSAPIGLPNPPSTSQKPFSITVTSIPSSRASTSSSSNQLPPPSLHSHKDSFSALLAQAEQQNRELVKKQQQHQQQQQQHHQQQQQQQQQHQHQQQQHQQQQKAAFNAAHASSSSHRKSYESMFAEINKVAEYSSKIGAYSHEAKVNKWLADQTLTEQLSAEYLNAPRRRRPRVDPTLLDWKKLTGEENVAVINRLTGKKVTGSKAPQLKRLGQWLMENPMFDVDPKWAELVKERGNLPHDLQKRLPGQERGRDKGKSPGRPPMMPSPNSPQSVNQANLVATSMASGLNFPSLGNLNNSLLTGLSLGNFDPKNNPLLMPFGGLPNLGALGGLGNLSNLGNMSLTNSLFANLAGLGLPSLAGMEALGATATSQAETNVVSSASTRNTNSMSTGSTSKSRTKMEPPTSKSSAPSTSTSSSISTTTPFPFFFPNPGLLYTPLGLGGLNPFSMQPGGVSSAYESLAQCGLLNPPTSSAATTSSSRKSTSASASATSRHSRDVADAMKRKESEKKSRYSVDPSVSLQHYTDAAIHAAALAAEERRRASIAERIDSEKKSTTETIELSDIADLSARIERKTKEQEMKEALEQLSKTSAELLTRNLEGLQQVSAKRIRTPDRHPTEPHMPPSLEVTLEPIIKKPRVDPKEHRDHGECNNAPSTAARESNPLPPPARPPSRPPSSHREISNPPPYPSRSPTPKIAATIEPVPEVVEATARPPPTTPPAVATPMSPSIVLAAATTAATTTTQSITSPAVSALAPSSSVKQSTPEPSPSLNTSSNSNKESNESVSSQPPAEESHSSPAQSTSSTGSAKPAESIVKLPSNTESESEDGKGTKSKKARGAKRLNPEPPVERKNLRSSAGRQARAAAERQARSLIEGEQQQQAEQHESHGSSE